MLKRDERYKIIRALHTAGMIKSFKDIFSYIPKTVVATDLGKKVDRFNVLINRVDKFTIEELYTIGMFCDLSLSEMLKLAEEEFLKQRAEIKRSHKT